MPPTADSSHPLESILVVTIDRLPAWILPAWGAAWVATPVLDGLAARGVVFDRLLTPAVDPRTTASDLLGHGGKSLLARAGAAGWRVAVITDQPGVVEAVKLPANAELTVVDGAHPAGFAADESATSLGRLFDIAAGMLAHGRQRVVWVHAGCLGHAWDAPDEFREAYLDPDDPPPPAGCGVPNARVDATTDPDLLVALRHVFAAQVTLLDRCLGRLVAIQNEQAAATRRLLLFAGLRGMPLGLHDWIGGAGDGPDLHLPYGESIHVPAVLVDPAGRMAGQRYGGLVIPADLGATLHALTGWGGAERPGEERWQGRSLTDLLTRWRVAPRDRIVVRGPGGDALITPTWHFIKAHPAAAQVGVQLFAKPDDFFEQTNVVDRCRDVAEELGAVMAGNGGADARRAWETPLSAAAG